MSQDTIKNICLTFICNNNISIKRINIARCPGTKGQDINPVGIVKSCGKTEKLTLQAPISRSKFSKPVTYISLKNKVREFEKRSKHFLFGDHLINSHNLIS